MHQPSPGVSARASPEPASARPVSSAPHRPKAGAAQQRDLPERARRREQLLPLVYEELRKCGRAEVAQERPGQTLQATALVHEAYLRLVGVETLGRIGTAAATSSVPRPRRCAGSSSIRPPQGPGPARRRAADISSRTARPCRRRRLPGRPPGRGRGPESARRGGTEIVELVQLRYFAGLTIEQAAETLNISRPHGQSPLGLRQGLAVSAARRLTAEIEKNAARRGRAGWKRRTARAAETRGRDHARRGQSSQSGLPSMRSRLPTVPSRTPSSSASCGEDAELLATGPGLACAHEEAGSFLECPPAVVAETHDRSASSPRHGHIGPYKLLEQIGEGGMGTVWMAEQTEPVKRHGRPEAHQAGHGQPAGASPASRRSGRPWR